MRSKEEWFEEYAVSHKNQTNINIHFICVPAIYFSIVGMLMSIDTTWLESTIGIPFSFWFNWTTIFFIPILFFYFQLSWKVALQMLLFTVACLLVNKFISNFVPLFYTSFLLFIIAWIGQFYGHKVEGEKPSFFKDIQFLLIGPLWVMKKVFG